MGFTKTNTQNTPGICKVEYIETKYVNAIQVLNHIATVNLTTAAAWQEIEFTGGTASFKQPKQRSAAGTYFNYALELKIPKSSATVANKLEELDGPAYLILRITDKNGEILILGEQENPMLLTDDLSIPASAYNGWTFNFFGKYTHRAYYQA